MNVNGVSGMIFLLLIYAVSWQSEQFQKFLLSSLSKIAQTNLFSRFFKIIK
tara:strand:- start:1253 stop:1405 length:153 start_codon:yes stop_codon:yes gene_type:complete